MTVMGPKTPKPLFTLPVEDDPLPWLTDQFREAGAFAFSERTTRVVPTPKAMSAALGLTSSIVTALSDHPKRFSVRFHPSKKTASTYLSQREVVIGIRPMLDPRLTEGQRAALMVSLAYHEVGHVIWTADMQAKVLARYGEDNKPAKKMFNVVHDLLLEAQQAKDYPGYAPTLTVKSAYWGKQWKVRFNSRANRMGAIVQATLYPQGTDWTVSDEASEFFAWATDWADRCRHIKAGKSPKYLFDLIDEGLLRLRLDEKDGPDPLAEDEDEEPPIPPTEEDTDEDFDDDYDDDGDSVDDTFDDDDDAGGEEDDSDQSPPVEDEVDDTFDPQEDEDDKDEPPTDEPPTEDESEDGDAPEADEDEEEDESEDDSPGGDTGQDTDEDEESDEDSDDGTPGEDDDEEDDSEEDSDPGRSSPPRITTASA